MDGDLRPRIPLAGFLVVFVAPLAFLLVIVPGLLAGGIAPGHGRLGPPAISLPIGHGFGPLRPWLSEPPSTPVTSPPAAPAPAPAPSLTYNPPVQPALVSPPASPPLSGGGTGTGSGSPGAVAQPQHGRGKHLGQLKQHRKPETES